MHLPPLPAVIHRSSRPLRRLLRWALVGLAGLLVLLALLFSGLRLALPYMNEHRADIAAWLSQAWGAPVTFAQIDVRLAGYRPQLVLTEVHLGANGPSVRSVGVSLALWRSLINARPMIGTLMLDRLTLKAEQSATGQWRVVGAPTSTANAASMDLALLRTHLPDLGSVSLNQAQIVLSNAQHSATQTVTLTAQARLRSHGWALSGALSIPAFGTEPVEVRAQGRLDQPWDTEIFVSTHDWALPAVQKSVRSFGGPSIRQRLGGCATQVEGVDCKEGMPLIDRGQLTGALWLHFLNGSLSRVQTNFDIQALKVSRMERIAGVSSVAEMRSSAALDAIEGRLRWADTAEGWRLDVDQLQVRVNPNESFPTQRVHLIHQAENTWFSADYADLKQLSVWLSTAPLPAHYLTLLGDNDLSGQAEQVRLHFAGDTLVSGALQLKHFGNVPGQRQWPVVGGADGQGGLSVSLFKQPEGWIAEFNQQHLVMALPGQWQEPLTIQALDGTVYWHDAPDNPAAGPVLFSPSLSLVTPDLKFSGQFRYMPPSPNTAASLDVLGQFSDIPVARIPAYLPRGVIGKDALAWLDHALPGASQTGRVTQGSVEFHGDPARFPFLQGGGWLAVNFGFDDLRLPYQPGWPVLQHAQGHIAFINQQFHAALTGGTVDGVPIAGGRVSLFDLDRPVLNVAIRTAAPLPDLLHFVGSTPLLSSSAVLHSIKTTGNAALSVDGSIGLDARTPTTLTGQLDLQGNGLSIPSANLSFTELKGQLQFTNTQVSGRQLTGKFDGAPIQWSVDTRGEPRQETTRISLNTSMQPMQVVRQQMDLPAAVQTKLSGKAAFSASVLLPHHGSEITLNAQTDWVGVACTLPAPLNKTATAAWPTTLSLQFTAGKLQQLSMTSAALNGWHADLRLLSNDISPKASERVPTEKNASTLSLSMDAPVFDWDDWQPLLADLSPAASPSTVQPTPLTVKLTTPAFHALGANFGAVQLSVQRHSATTEVQLKGALLDGALSYQAAEAGGQSLLNAQLNRLYLPSAPDHPTHAPPAPITDWDLSHLPAGKITIADLRRGQQQLGALAFTMTPTTNRWMLNDLSWQPNADTRFIGRAAVTGQAAEQNTALTLAATGTAFGKTIKQLLGSSPINEGEINQLHLELNWPGSPEAFAEERLNGAGLVRLKSGQINEVDPGAGRLAGLLSLSALTKRLRLDFSDVLDRGLQFDELNADWVMHDGVLQVEPFTLKNASLHMSASGSTNLADDSLNYRVNVYADVGMLLPIIGTVAGGPLVGGAVLAVQQALKSIDKNPSPTLSYQISGTLEKPIIQSVSSSSKDAPTPDPTSTLP